MKKKISVLVLVLVCSFPMNICAQNSGLYLISGVSFLSSGMTFDKDQNGDYYSLSPQTLFLSIGLGYKTNSGFGLEFGAMVENVSLNLKNNRDENNYDTGASALGVSAYQCVPLTNEINWYVSLSYRMLFSKVGFNEILIEPIMLEYRRRNSHWGFKLSVVSIEGLIMPKESNSKDDLITGGDPGSAGFGLGFNSFPVRVSLYF